MRHLKKPDFNALDILNLCIKSIQNKDLTDRLSFSRQDVVAAEEEYYRYGELQGLFQVIPTESIGGVDIEEMKKVYKNTFVKSVKTRNIYDQIKKLPLNDICPICGQRTVEGLDHYLAQSMHPALVVTPINLVPACNACNKAKLDAQPKTAEEQTLHPYFDFVDDERWLFASVVNTSPASLLFYALPPSTWPDVKRDRVMNHFRIFGLGSLYASHSGVELTLIRYALQKLASIEVVRNELIVRMESARDAQLNSWQTAMYSALAESDWFCSGGFNLK
ncbi:hypothetical protein U2P60_01210 [Brucella sp. H1_1004]|uniref:hypothetical protein n=1 Tax=Brucella sp. H1_1004 TaxID=3110109 RepID=UPI0039B394A5